MTDRPPKVPRFVSEVERLRERAAKASSAAKARVSLNLRIPVDLYKALVELAEEYHAPISEIAKQCLSDGVRKYRDFQIPRRGNFGTRTPMQVIPEVLARPTNPHNAIERLQQRAKSSRSALQQGAELVKPDPDEIETAIQDAIYEGLGDIPAGALFPFGGNPPSAPSAKEANDG